ncbi:cyclin-J isoform X1 [Plutella xylostella]|uniref:cyclin-J isoform X1 n=1 Tax=Plutella xylostella TaxID=51655 RepID=UPI002032AE7E|nr:cyclin-J isoform X1 [Plutella xylostella]
METSMSRLNLSSVRSQAPTDATGMTDTTADSIVEATTNSLTNSDDDCNCEYKDDIWNHLLEQEAEKPTLHLQSPQLEFRGALVQQLRDVSKKLGLSVGTLHSAVHLLDLFMDAHRLRADRLTHVALACLSLAAKSEEKLSRAPTLKTLSRASGAELCGATLRQLEWMVGQHARWRLLTPTPVSFASLLAQYVVTDADLTTRHPKFVRRFKRDGARLLEAYLDLTLSDVRLKLVSSVAVGAACVACARAELGLRACPAALPPRARAQPLVPVARLLQRMMQIVKSRESATDSSEADQGYGSARTSPSLTPCASPRLHISPASSSCSSSSRSHLNVDSSYRHNPIPERRENNEYSILDLANNTTNTEQPYTLPQAIDINCQRVDNPTDFKYSRARRLIEASFGTVEPSTSKAVKRGLDSSVEMDQKRYRLTTQMSQVVI